MEEHSLVMDAPVEPVRSNIGTLIAAWRDILKHPTNREVYRQWGERLTRGQFYLAGSIYAASIAISLVITALHRATPNPHHFFGFGPVSPLGVALNTFLLGPLEAVTGFMALPLAFAYIMPAEYGSLRSRFLRALRVLLITDSLTALPSLAMSIFFLLPVSARFSLVTCFQCLGLVAVMSAIIYFFIIEINAWSAASGRSRWTAVGLGVLAILPPILVFRILPVVFSELFGWHTFSFFT